MQAFPFADRDELGNYRYRNAQLTWPIRYASVDEASRKYVESFDRATLETAAPHLFPDGGRMTVQTPPTTDFPTGSPNR
jgi:hypothetical protein